MCVCVGGGGGGGGLPLVTFDYFLFKMQDSVKL